LGERRLPFVDRNADPRVRRRQSAFPEPGEGVQTVGQCVDAPEGDRVVPIIERLSRRAADRGVLVYASKER